MDDQAKILKHFGDTVNGLLDAETFKKHKAEVLVNYSFLLGNAKSQEYVRTHSPTWLGILIWDSDF